MLPRTAHRVAGLGAAALLLAALSVPGTAQAAPAPQAAVGALAAVGAAPYSAYSSGDVLYANAANLGPDIAKASTGQSAAGAGVNGGALVTADQLKQPLLYAGKAGKTAYGHAAGVNVGLITDLDAQPQIGETTVEATSPAPSADSGNLLAVPASPLATVTVLPSEAVANTTADGSCVIGKDISRGKSAVSNAEALIAGGVTVVDADDNSDSTSRTTLIKPTKANGTVVNTGKSGLLGQTTLNIAPVTLLKGTPAEITIEVLAPIQLSAAAGGVAGTSVVSYGAVGRSGTQPVVELTIGGQTIELTSQQVFGGNGVILPLGLIDVTIGSKAHSLTGLEGTSPTTSANGTQASASADFIRVSVPGKLTTPGTDPVDGPLGPVLNPVLNPVLSGLDPVLSALQDALDSAGLDLADVRLGHTEASATVPVGGIDCSNDNPLDESYKDVSALRVAPGASFDYDLRIPNRGDADITNVKVVDTFDSRLQFVKSVPAPTSRSGNTLTYDLGTIKPNEFKVIVLTFKVPASATVGTKYRNDARITGTYKGRTITKDVGVPGPTAGPVRTGDCNLSGSTKFASNTEVKTGEVFGYFVNVLNSGGKPCLNTTVSDTLISGVTFVSCTAGCTHSGQVVTWKLGTVAPGESRVLSVLVKVTATSGRLPNTATVSSPSGTGGRPTTPGPVVTGETVGSPGNPADGPNGELPRTGLPAGPAALATALLIGAAALVRRRSLTA